MTSNILKIKDSKIRLFPLQTMDHSFMLVNDLPTSYLITLLIDRLGFLLKNISLEYVYPTNIYTNLLLENIWNYDEDYFIFYLENYYHSNDFALLFIKTILEKISKLKWKKPKIIIHTLKAELKDCKELIEKYAFVVSIVCCDIEYFFNEIFYKKTNLEDIENILWRKDDLEVKINKTNDILYDLWDYIIWAYHSKHYSHFPKSKDYIISLLKDDDENTDKYIYHKKPKEEFIKLFRKSPQTKVMLTTWRWCKYNCSYCYRWAKYSKVRQIPIETIKKDLDYLEKTYYEDVYFYDDCFPTTNYDRLDEILDLLSKYNFSYCISARYEICSPEILKKFAKANITMIQIWLQSVSLEANKESKRWFRQEAFSKILSQMKDLWIGISLDIILWLPWEWLKWFLKTFNYALASNPEVIYINWLFLNPWTELYRNRQKYWIITNLDKGYKNSFHVPSVSSSDYFSTGDIKFARKYIAYYIEKTKNTSIISR